MAGNQVATATRQTPALYVALENRHAAFEAMLPKSMPAARFIGTVKTAYAQKPEIRSATVESVIACCMKAAQDGLLLDGREAALVIRNVRVSAPGVKPEKWEKHATYQPMFQGLMKRARNSGQIALWVCDIVYENDEFKHIKGDNPQIIHNPSMEQNPGPMTHVYSIVTFKDGSIARESMTRRQVDEIKARTSSKKKDKDAPGGYTIYGAWITDYEEMSRKTVIKRHSKFLPVDSDLRRIIDAMDTDIELDAPAPAPAPREGVSAADRLNAAAFPDDPEPAKKDDPISSGTKTQQRAKPDKAKKTEPAKEPPADQDHDAETGEVHDDGAPENYDRADDDLI